MVTFVACLIWPQVAFFVAPLVTVVLPGERVLDVAFLVTLSGLAVWFLVKGAQARYLARKLIFLSVGVVWVLLHALKALPRLQPERAIVYYSPMETALRWIFVAVFSLAMVIDGLEYRRKSASI